MRLLRVCVLGAFLLAASPAAAGPVEQVVQLARHPTDPNVAVLRYKAGGDGFFFTRDAGASWQLLCGSIIQPALRSLGHTAIAGDGHTMFGIFGGVVEDDGTACTWTTAPELADKWITDIVNDPLDPSIAYAVSSNGGELNGIFRRDASGAWTMQGLHEDALISRLLAVPTGATSLRFYESIGRLEGDAGTTSYTIRYSDDGGDNWTEYPYGMADGSLRLEAVDPSNTDRLLVSIGDSQLLVSRDAGQTLTDYLTVVQLGGIAFAPDGRVWIADAGDIGDPTNEYGLWYAPSLDQGVDATKVIDEPITCVTHYESSDTVKVCTPRGFGVADTTAGTVEEEFNMLHATQILSCASRDVREECARQLGADNSDGLCAETHFPCTPLCADYNVPLTNPTMCCDKDGGVCPTTTDTGGTGGAVTGGTGGVTGGTGGAVTGGTGGAVTGGTGGIGGTAAAGASGSAGSGSDTSDDGCSCSLPGRRTPHASLPGLAFAVGLLGTLWSRRRRRS